MGEEGEYKAKNRREGGRSAGKVIQKMGTKGVGRLKKKEWIRDGDGRSGVRAEVRGGVFGRGFLRRMC